MPSTLESLAAFIQDPRLAAHSSERIARLNLHIADTLAMMLEGARLAEGRTAIAVGPRLAGWCAAARMTEADDIHLTSCTTPGSVVVSTALHLAADGAFETWSEFVTAILAGYETLIRVGYAIDGPRVLARKVWPTLFAAGMGSTAVACRAWRLDVSQTAGALATALAAATGIAPPSAMPNSTRCISLGLAAEHGVFAAAAARQNALGDVRILENRASRIAGVPISPNRLRQQLSKRFFFDEAGLKPYPVARQALAAVEACRQLVGRNVRGISGITVAVPSAQARIIDQPWPSNRMQSISSVRYQIAIALLAPDKLMEFDRTPPFETDALRTLAGKIRVRTDARLEACYPETWPARVVVEWAGRRKSALVKTPRGDSPNPLDWTDVLQKTPRFAAALSFIQGIQGRDPIPELLRQHISIVINHRATETHRKSDESCIADPKSETWN